MTKKTGTLPALPDALPSLPDVPWSSLEFHEDWLTDAVHSRNIHTTAATAAVGAERDNGVAHPTLLNRITSSSSRTSRRSIRSVQSTRSGHSEDAMTFEGSESITPIVEEQRPISDCNVEAQYEEEEEERWPTASDYPVEIQYKEEAKEQEFAQDQDRKEEEEEERYPEHDGSGPLLSPYIIDESCDDDFFLNSVLRKKSKPQPLSLVSTSTGAGARLGAGGWPSSAGRTPSLTNSIFTSSSQTSSATPSPTTPMFASSHSQNHGSSAPIMIHAGLDEKRTRLSDAVKEWRRSTNMSSGYIDSLTQPNFAV
ncbi:hypothetical protein BGZ58_005856 [Dissophora ornata]|nr:hypothetical protein BGZ58_005856 [Dissophora ornata]